MSDDKRSVFGRLPEDHPLAREARRRKAEARLKDGARERQPSFKQRNPEAWAREILTNLRDEARERREKKEDA